MFVFLKRLGRSEPVVGSRTRTTGADDATHPAGVHPETFFRPRHLDLEAIRQRATSEFVIQGVADLLPYVSFPPELSDCVDSPGHQLTGMAAGVCLSKSVAASAAISMTGVP
jgi:hypothetical protein